MIAFMRSISRGPVIVIGAAAFLLAVDDLLASTSAVDHALLASALLLAIAASAVLLVIAPEAAGEYLKAHWPRLILGLGVSLVAAALSLVAAEFATRWVFRDITTTSDDRGYFSARWQRTAVQFNAHGFRERQVPFSKAPGIYRIAVVGDSFTFGNGIPSGRRFSELMQPALGAGLEVLNFGLPGNNTTEETAVIRQAVRSYTPDFILVQWFVNDVEGSSNARPQYSTLLPYQALHDRLQRSSALYTLANSWWTRRQTLGLRAKSYADYMRAQYADPQSPASLASMGELRDLGAAATELGAGVGLVLFPDTGYDLGKSYPFGFLHDRVLEFCRETRITCMDLRPDFALVKRRESLWANRMDAHPSAQANAIAADRILQAFKALWLDRSQKEGRRLQ